MKNSTVLITGGLGAIGINLVNKLKDKVKKIVIVDNLSSGRVEFLEECNLIELFRIDIYRLDEISTIFQKYDFDYIFHLAAHFANQNSVDHPYSDIQTNVIGTVNLLELSKKQKSLKKFVYASSSCLYGDNESMVEESMIYPHETPYAINKYTAELYTKYYAHLFQVPTISIRIFNTFGPYEVADKYRNVIPKFVHRALNDEDIVITGTGEESRDFTYCSDTIELLLLAALSDIKNGDYFNGGTGTETNILDLAKMVIEISNSKSHLEFIERRNWDLVTSRVSDITKSKQILGYNPQTKLYDGLKKYIEWYVGYLNNVK